MPLCPARPCKCNEVSKEVWVRRAQLTQQTSNTVSWFQQRRWCGKWGLHNLLSYESIFEVLVMRGLWAGIDVFVHPAKSPSLLRPKCIFTPGCVQMYNHTNVEMYIYTWPTPRSLDVCWTTHIHKQNKLTRGSWKTFLTNFMRTYISWDRLWVWVQSRDTQSWHLLKNMKLAHLSIETKTVEIAMGCGLWSIIKSV